MNNYGGYDSDMEGGARAAAAAAAAGFDGAFGDKAVGSNHSFILAWCLDN